MKTRNSAFFAVCCLSFLIAAPVLADDPPAMSDSEIRKLMIRESLGSYSGNCPCPYNSDRAGRRCGGRSAYSRPGGASPLCYDRDISDEQVERFRDRREIPKPK